MALAAPEVLYDVRDWLVQYPAAVNAVGLATVAALIGMAWLQSKGPHYGFGVNDVGDFRPRTWKQRYLCPGVVLVVALIAAAVLDLLEG